MIGAARALVAGAFVCVALTAPAAAFLIQTAQVGGGRFIQSGWRSDVLSFWIDDAGSDDIGAAETVRILRQSFDVWQRVPSARVRFDDRGLSRDRAPGGRDGRNQVIFDETGECLGAPSGSGVIAVTRLSTNTFSGQILDADIIFNGRDHRFSAEPRAGHVLLSDVAVHEIGHLLGLDHTPLAGAPQTRPTMNPFYVGDGPGEATTLEADDVAGVSALFPTAAFLGETGTLAGRVVDLEGKGVFGAVVTAEEVVTGEVYSTLSGAETGPSDPGAYTVRGLPAGSYRLAIAPLGDGMDESNFGGAFVGFDTDFPAEFHDNVERPGLARSFDIAFPSLHLTQLDFVTGFRIPGEAFIRVVDELGNTPDLLGPYTPQFEIEDAEYAELLIDVDGTGFRLPLTSVDGRQYGAEIPGQPVGSRVRYRARATSASGAVTEYPAGGQWLQFDVIGLSGSPLVFAVLRDDGVLGVFDTGAMDEVARVDLGADPIQVLTSEDGRHLFVSNHGADEITVVETASFRIVDRIAVASQPLDMALSPDGRRLYVSNSGAASLTEIDVASGSVVRSTGVGLQGDGPYGVVAGDRGRVYLTDLVNDAVLIVAEGVVVARIPVSAGPRSLALSADGTQLFVTSFRSSRLTIIDAMEEAVSATLNLPVAGSFAVALHPAGDRLYVTGHEDGVVVVVDVDERSVAEVISVGTNPRGLSFSPDGQRLFVTSATSEEIFVVDAATHELLDTYRAAGGPRGISVVEAPDRAPELPTLVLGDTGPTDWALSDIHPNPFNPSASLSVTAAAAGPLMVEVYNAVGQRVRRLTLTAPSTGIYSLSWDGRDEGGRAVSSGVYLFVVNTPVGRLARKGMLLR